MVGSTMYTHINIFGHKFRKFLIFLVKHRRLSSIALSGVFGRMSHTLRFSLLRHFLEDFLLRSLAVRVEVPEPEVEGSADNLTKVPRKKNPWKNLRQSQHTCLFCKIEENFLYFVEIFFPWIQLLYAVHHKC